MALELKDYQKKALEALEAFFSAVRGTTTGTEVEAAFASARRAALGEAAPPLPYRHTMQENFLAPQVCVRIPTGGGKTLLAAHTIERAARLYAGVPFPLVIWLVPSNTIRTQTLDALKTPGHPYREALLSYYAADRLTVLDIADCEQLRAQDFGSRTIVAVGTIQTLRVDNTASRDVYAYKESFEPHFAKAPETEFFERISEGDLVAQPYLTKGDLGKIKRSFANLLAWHRPIVIVDEAHNARSDLSFEVFRRIRPACIIEWTATPARDQNVLYHVSAQELKAENMVKLPIVLSPHPNWQEAVRDAVLTRDRLAKDAASESEYVRPIVLLQADARDGEVPVEALKSYLIETLHIGPDRIAVATGSQRELDGVNLFDRACAIDFVITVEALKEGWDCSFAYVFCTVQNIRSARDMEQLLGRVLRLPYATRRKADTLNRAYAHVSAPITALVANDLADRLVAMGFEEVEAAQFIQPEGSDLFGDAGPHSPSAAQTTLVLPAAVAKALANAAPGSVAATQGAEGTSTVTLTGVIPAAAVEAAIAAASRRDRDAIGSQIERHQVQAHVAAAPSQRHEPFPAMPVLALPLQGELVLYEPAVLDEVLELSLAGVSADLPSFQADKDPRPYLIDIEAGHLRVSQDLDQFILDLNAGSESVRREDLIRELDRRTRSHEFVQADMIAWLGRVVDGLSARGITPVYGARHINRLSDVVSARITEFKQSQRKTAFQKSLIEGDSSARLDSRFDFTFDSNDYPARWQYQGRYNFSKHYYPLPGELSDDPTAEETACAIEIDSLAEVKFWVRNLERQPLKSFWLPTSTDRFYPDFVVSLNDGRMLVVEYKGGDRYSNDDSREKRDIGKVWASLSRGRCCFAMITDAQTAGKSVSAQIRETFR